MVSSDATNVEQYLRELPADRRREIEAVRAVVRDNLPFGYIETMEYGMIGYSVPLARFPDTYNGRPLCFAGLAAQKHYNALYLMCTSMDATQDRALRAGAAKEGKKLDMGKACVRFAAAADLPLRTIGAVIKRTPVAKLIALHDATHAKGKGKAAKGSARAGTGAKAAKGAKATKRAAGTKASPPRSAPAAKAGKKKVVLAEKAAWIDRRAAAAATRARSRRKR